MEGGTKRFAMEFVMIAGVVYLAHCKLVVPPAMKLQQQHNSSNTAAGIASQIPKLQPGRWELGQKVSGHGTMDNMTSATWAAQSRQQKPTSR